MLTAFSLTHGDLGVQILGSDKPETFCRKGSAIDALQLQCTGLPGLISAAGIFALKIS